MDSQKPNQPVLDQKTRNEVALISYVNDLMKEYTDPVIRPEDIGKAREMLLVEVQDFINRHFLSLLSDEKQLEFGKVLDENPTEEKGYLRSAVDSEFYQKINSQEVAGAIISFRAHYQI